MQELVDISKYNKPFEDVLINLSIDDNLNFYAHVLFNMNLRLTRDIDTAGVYYKNEKFNIDINPEFMFEVLKDVKDRMYLLIHEIHHVLYKHFDRVKSRDKKLWNIAGDLAINQSLFKRLNPNSALAQIGINIGDKSKYNFPANLTSEEYYELILEDSKNNPDKYESGLGIEDLLESDEISDIEKEMITDKLKEIIQRSKDKSVGNVPDEILQLIDILFAPAVVNWQDELRYVVGNKRINKECTVKKRARRFPHRMDIYGKVKRSGFTVACIVDESGSMSNDEIMKGLAEINAICEFTSSTMTIVQVDTKASEPFEYSSYNGTFERKHQGGTYLYPGVEKLVECEVEFDALLVITDGEIESSWPEVLDIPVFFLVTTNNLYFDISVSEMYKKFMLNDKK